MPVNAHKINVNGQLPANELLKAASKQQLAGMHGALSGGAGVVGDKSPISPTPFFPA
jgi:hypothetical protein